MNIIGISGLHNAVTFKKRELPNLSPRSYRIVQGLDSAAALVTSEGIKAVAAEERFTQQKATGAFPANAIQYCLKAANLSPNSIDYVAHGFDYEPFHSFYDQFTEFNKKQFTEVYSRQAQINHIHEFLPSYDWDDKLVRVPHHLAHAASTFYPSGFHESLIFIADAMGEIHSTTIATGRGKDITILAQIPAPHSLGLFYGIFTLYLGFKMASDEYKVMGLAPYGNPRRYFSKVMDLIYLNKDGTFAIPILFANKTIEEQETYSGTLRILAETFGAARDPNDPVTQDHMDLAAALQSALQACMMHVLRHFKAETGESNLCMAGGVALNCTANSVIRRSRMFKNMFVQPAAGDDGSALGAALFVQATYDAHASFTKMALPLWGPEYDNDTIGQILSSRDDCDSKRYACYEQLVDDVARRLAEGQVIAWFQGRMEFGPRALGNRSILADPRRPDMRSHINRLVKKREEFRPFAPSVTAEAANQYFELDDTDKRLDAYMLFVTQVKANYRQQLPSITHVDNSARIQIVSQEQNPRYWTLITKFGEITNLSVLLNTSFNLRDQPIVCDPVQAIDTFVDSEIDALAIGDYLVTRSRKD
jgi:carbamoyltransferase